MFRGIVYKTSCLKTKKSYIGQQRKITNKNIKEYLGSGKLLRNVIKKYGKENFKKIILIDKYFKSKKELDEEETKYIDKENTLYPNGYNKRRKVWPPSLAARKQGIETSRRNETSLFNPKIQMMGSIAGITSQRKNKTGFFNSELQSKLGKRGGKLGGKRSMEKNKKNKVGWFSLEIQKRLSKIAHKSGNQYNAIFEIDGVYHQMTLGKIKKL
jgi:hypothetical protein